MSKDKKKIKNKLNELSGKEWIKFTKSWFIHNPPRRKELEILHPAKFPEKLIQDFIEFFTKKKEWVLDPFLGTGSTLIASKKSFRNAIGIELSEKYAIIAKKRLSEIKIEQKISDNPNDYFNPISKVISDDSINIKKIWRKYELPLIDYCITSPPYWNQLKRNHIRQLKRKKEGLDTKYSENLRDIGNIDDYKLFIEEQKKIFNKVYKVMKNKAYLTIITNNVFANGRIYPLAFDTLISLSNIFVPKDEKIWLQNDKALLPLGINNAWVGNRHHQYCLIFRKETDKLE